MKIDIQFEKKNFAKLKTNAKCTFRRTSGPRSVNQYTTLIYGNLIHPFIDFIIILLLTKF